MTKPNTLKDLLAEGHISLSEVRVIARGMFDGETTAAGPEGYIITAANFDDLPDSARQFIVKGILEFKVKNVLDASDDEPEEDTRLYDDANYEASEIDVEPPTVDNEVI